jgi:hypothetical protein
MPVESLFAEASGFLKTESIRFNLSFCETDSNKSTPTEKVSLSLA